MKEVRVNRKKLREWLLIGISVEWGKKLVKYEEETEGVTAYFEDGTYVRGSMLVGADGVNSVGVYCLRQLFFHQYS